MNSCFMTPICFVFCMILSGKNAFSVSVSGVVGVRT
jgi:hypothetical protein